jgi:hypothetical protein
VLTVLLAWSTVLAASVAAALLGQNARTAPHRRGRRAMVRTRLGLVASRSGPWLALLAGFGTAAVTGAWLVAAAGTLAAVVVVATAGLVLAPD